MKPFQVFGYGRVGWEVMRVATRRSGSVDSPLCFTTSECEINRLILLAGFGQVLGLARILLRGLGNLTKRLACLGRPRMSQMP